MPSVAHPPFPLHVFLPLQPLSPLLQPPWPLQVFCPLHECVPLSSIVPTFTPEGFVLPVLAAIVAAVDPASIPAMAAAASDVLAVISFMVF